MAHNSLFPASVRINYSSAYGVHSMSIPTVKFALDAGSYKFMREDLTFIGVADTLITAWVNAIKVFFPNTVTFIDWIGFTYDTPTSPGAPLTSGVLAIVGTHAMGAGFQAKATQATYTWRTDEFGISKIVFLDTAVGSFEKKTNAADGNVSPLHAIVASADPWIRGRDGGKPQVFLQVAYTLNEKLRKSYRMN